MFNNKLLKAALKTLTIIGIVVNISLFYLLFLVDIDYSQSGMPPYGMVTITNTLTYLLQLFLAYGLWNLYLFLQKNNTEHLKKFGVILLGYTLLKIINGAVSSVLLSWYLGENNRVVNVDIDETTLIFVSFSLLVIYLSNLLPQQTTNASAGGSQYVI
jgi:hypothetical protein